MRFYKISDSVLKKCNNNSKIKAEYFWHYWDFLFTKNRDLILVKEPKFVSQISLIHKIEKHLEWNNGINSKKLLKYFNCHLYFHRDNLILRSNEKLLARITKIKNEIEDEARFNREFKRECFLEKFRLLKQNNFDINDFSIVLIEKLSKIIYNDRELNNQVKQDLKFLCNSIIDILVLRGYSLIFIKGLLSNTIFNSGNKLLSSTHKCNNFII